MCGRIRQAREPVEYEESMSWNARDLGNLADGLREQRANMAHLLVPQSNADGLALWRRHAEVHTELALFSVTSKVMEELKGYVL